MSRAKSTESAPKFEAALSELESLVEKLESGQLSLEDSLSAYQRGAELLQRCHVQLNEADARLKVLEDGKLKLLNIDLDGGS
jgi:exodeoxyribonuclease VII small subunit